MRKNWLRQITKRERSATLSRKWLLTLIMLASRADSSFQAATRRQWAVAEFLAASCPGQEMVAGSRHCSTTGVIAGRCRERRTAIAQSLPVVAAWNGHCQEGRTATACQSLPAAVV